MFLFSLVGRATGAGSCADPDFFSGAGGCAVCAGAGGAAAGNHPVSVFCGAGVSCLCGHKLRIASCSASAAQRRMAAPFRIGGSGGGDFPSHGLAGKKPGIRP